MADDSGTLPRLALSKLGFGSTFMAPAGCKHEDPPIRMSSTQGASERNLATMCRLLGWNLTTFGGSQ